MQIIELGLGNYLTASALHGEDYTPGILIRVSKNHGGDIGSDVDETVDGLEPGDTLITFANIEAAKSFLSHAADAVAKFQPEPEAKYPHYATMACWKDPLYRTAYIRRDSEREFAVVNRDGSESECYPHNSIAYKIRVFEEAVKDGTYKLISEKEAKALLTPQEDPEEYVILDPVKYADHVPRVGIDEFSPGVDHWEVQRPYHSKQSIGDYFRATKRPSRCKRKHLPGVTNP